MSKTNHPPDRTTPPDLVKLRALAVEGRERAAITTALVHLLDGAVCDLIFCPPTDNRREEIENVLALIDAVKTSVGFGRAISRRIESLTRTVRA